MKNNKWIHGKTNLVYPKQSVNLFRTAGIYYQHLILDTTVGEEVVLIIYDDTDFIYELAAVSPFVFNCRGMGIRTSYGTIGVLLFHVENPLRPGSAYAIYDKPVDITRDEMLQPWRELDNQTHLHLILLDKNLETAGFFIFENFGAFGENVQMFSELGKNQTVDFNKAEAEYYDRYSLEAMFEMSQKSQKN